MKFFFTNKKKLTQNTLNAIDAVRASGAIVPESTIDLIVQMDNGQLTEDEAIKKISFKGDGGWYDV